MPRGVGVRVPLSARATAFGSRFFFVRIKALVQRVAPRQTCLWSVVVCYANIRACCAIVTEKRFSPHRPSIPTIFDCNNLPSACSRLLPPFESRCCVFDNLSRYCTMLFLRRNFRKDFPLFFVIITKGSPSRKDCP